MAVLTKTPWYSLKTEEYRTTCEMPTKMRQKKEKKKQNKETEM